MSYASLSSLKKLSLGGNRICSLHQLSTLKAESLEELLLWQNKIRNLKSLRKVKFPNLKKIDISSNLLIEVDGFSELNAKVLSYVNMDINMLSNLDHLIKATNFIQNGRLLLLSNPIISVFGDPTTSGGQKLFRIIFSK
jgi:Leucine-rich repeat (LRR) protein